MITLPKLRNTDTELSWGGFHGASQSLAIATLVKQEMRPILVIAENIQQAERLRQEILFFAENLRVDLFPDWETLPYDHFSPHQDIISERLALLARLPQQHSGITIAAASTLMHRLLPKTHLIENSFVVKVGDELDPTVLKTNLTHAGYRHVGQVLEHGEFTVRGAIIDVFPMGAKMPFRLELFDNEIESLREFDPETQLSKEKMTAINLLPAHEYPLNENGINEFRKAWREKFTGNPTEAPLYQKISHAEAAAGVEYYLPLFYQTTSHLFDYLDPKTVIILQNDVQQRIQQFWQELNERYEQLRYDISRPLLEPKALYLDQPEFNGATKSHLLIKLTTNIKGNEHYQLQTTKLPDITINHRLQEPLTKLRQFIVETSQQRRLFCADSTGRRETLMDLLNQINLKPTIYQNWDEFIQDNSRLGIVVAALENGADIQELNLILITENELLGQPTAQQRSRKSRLIDPNTIIRNLTELSLGSPVVHINHGVGRYRGLQMLKTGDIEAEYLTLEYANQDKIYVPVGSLHLISRYSGADAEHAPLQRLGTKQWDKIKSKTAEKIRDVAAELLDIYGRRLATLGHCFKVDKENYQKFTDAFPFTETEDQSKAIQAVLMDLQKQQCMDRLVCGDVGFGKTEVAMRAAFVAAMNNKQVVVLVPTTLLASQHLQNFQDRFSEWPIKIAGLSRLQTASEEVKILQGLESGGIDIVIGTHKLLSENIKYKDLGLLIIDEEQRFGVRQKERITALRANIDILTLTATPIPRTLNMAMSGTRDLSIIATPPARRLSVKTFIHEQNPVIIREAILREILRGGQVYYLHNDVATIEHKRNDLMKIIPEAKISVAHGQMRERDLERVMADFYHQRFNVVVCSTIIESGIDIPSANTIIIDRADKFGLAQLHQLRGRVGRSHHQAYAYLLIPHQKKMTKDAEKRLEAIAELGDLGVGFSLATYDLEIRGAGALLGEEQSGHIHEVGFTLYMELLEEAVAALKAGREPEFDKPLNSGVEIELNISALLPNDYIGDVQLRLTLYKRLGNCKTFDAIQDLKAELIDRFGLLPPAAENLFSIAKLKVHAEKLGITKIEVSKNYGYLHFSAKPSINLEKLIQLIQKQAKTYQMQGTSKLRFVIDSTNSNLTQIDSLLNQLKN